MKRAAVIIGVDRTGGLPALKDAAQGARRFEHWARLQGIEAIEVLTDENGRAVEARDVKKAIRRIVEAGTHQQLLIYFAGHGVNIAYGEYWLLTGAPADTQEAVNVPGSEALARYCGIPHVVFISDACRTAAEGIQAQRVTGSEIFPNEGAGGLENPVDQLLACSLGRPALEVRNPDTTAREFRALYTAALLEGLGGEAPQLLEWVHEGEEKLAFVRPRPLKKYLSEEVSRRIAKLNLETRVIQVPDGRINSDPAAWLARLQAADVARISSQGARHRGMGQRVERLLGPSEPEIAPATAETVSASLLRSALSGDAQNLRSALGQVPTTPFPNAAAIAHTVEQAATPFGPMHHETGCGFKVRGARIIEAFSLDASTELFGTPGEVVRVDGLARPGASVLLVFESGSGVVLPALPEFLTALTIEDGELVDIAYEPSDNTWRWNDYQPRAAEIRSLRAVAAASTRSGVFRLHTDDALAVARRMQVAKGIDPALAVYAAYAYNDLQRRDLIRQMSGYMDGDLGGRLFDVALLAGELDGRRAGSDGRTFGFVPLLAQGWALLAAYRVSLPASLGGLRAAMRPSVWTMFDAAGVDLIRAAMQAGDVR